MFKFIKTSIDDVYIIEPEIHGDNRGFFSEVYKQADFCAANLNYTFVQTNLSKSKKGVLRGLHYQRNFPQAKLVMVLEGEVFDVAVDLRKNSATYGKWIGVILSGENKKMLMIPRGFAHGFLVLSESATFMYKCDDTYHPEDEGGIIWNDPSLKIKWPINNKIELSVKDQSNPSLEDCNISFDL